MSSNSTEEQHQQEDQNLSLVVSQSQQQHRTPQTVALRLPFLRFYPTTPPPSPAIAPHRSPPLLPLPPPAPELQDTSLWPLLSGLTRQLEEWIVSGQISSNNLVVFINPATGSATVVEGGGEGEWWVEKTGASPASKAAIDALGKVEVRENEERRECVVCLEEFEVGEEVKEMPCKHRFHELCINKWLHIHGNCPLCRFAIEKDGDDEEEEEEEREWRRRGNYVSVRAFLVEGGGGGGDESNGVGDGEALAAYDDAIQHVES